MIRYYNFLTFGDGEANGEQCDCLLFTSRDMADDFQFFRWNSSAASVMLLCEY